jgi:tRNA(fMet)-specific endonuclease VapC
MIVLDTDHLSEFQKGTSSAAKQLKDRLNRSDQPIATTIVSAEELLRGWLAAIHREHNPHRQIRAYKRLGQLFEFFGAWRVLPWDEAASGIFTQLKRQRLRIGTMDLKIASISLVHDARLLSSNLRDFRAVPGLRVDDWLIIRTSE